MGIKLTLLVIVFIFLTQISNLREEYKKRCPGPTGDETPDWIHFQALHKILHERPALNSSVAVTSEIGLEDEVKFKIYLIKFQ